MSLEIRRLRREYRLDDNDEYFVTITDVDFFGGEAARSGWNWDVYDVHSNRLAGDTFEDSFAIARNKAEEAIDEHRNSYDETFHHNEYTFRVYSLPHMGPEFDVDIRYLGDMVMGISGFDTLENAKAWAEEWIDARH